MTIPEFVRAFRVECSERPFGLLFGLSLRQEDTGFCPLVAVANSKLTKRFSNGDFIGAGTSLGLSALDCLDIANASDTPYAAKKGLANDMRRAAETANFKSVVGDIIQEQKE